MRRWPRYEEMAAMTEPTRTRSDVRRLWWDAGLVATFLIAIAQVGTDSARAQTPPREQLVFLTAEWKGERFPDGRPKVPDQVLARMSKVSIEEAWGYLRSHGYQNQ